MSEGGIIEAARRVVAVYESAGTDRNYEAMNAEWTGRMVEVLDALAAEVQGGEPTE
jgi:hypothetical protein